MERKYLAALAAVILLMAVAFGVRSMANPFVDRGAQLQARLNEIKPVEVKLETGQSNFDRWKDTIISKPSVWKELIPKPLPPPPPPPKPPNLKKMLAEVQVTRQGFGDKVRIMTKEEPKGIFLGPGDSVAGLQIKEVTRQSVTFSLNWQGQELTEVVERR